MIRSFAYLALCIIMTVSSASAQQLVLSNEAAKLCQEKNYEAALLKIAEAKLSPEEADSPYLWYVDGFIHKEIYKASEMNNRASSNREIAAESFLRSLELDSKNQHAAMTKLSLKFIASSYYNDALVMTREFDLSTESLPETLFAKFRRFMHYAEPGTSLKKFDVEFGKSMGQRYFQLWLMNIEDNQLSDKSIARYLEVVRNDSTDTDALYNVSVVYYNRAVFKYRKIGPETDIFDLIIIQQDCAELIKNRALPYMDKAYKLSPERGDIIRGLMYIHRALEHENDVEYFKKEIERLIQEGKITLPEK